MKKIIAGIQRNKDSQQAKVDRAVANLPPGSRKRKPIPSAETLNFLLEEGEDWLYELIDLWHRLRRTKAGGGKYLNVMAEVAAAASRVHVRMESVMDEIDGITDALPDDK